MKKIIILTDDNNKFLISIADLKHYTSMDIEKVKQIFLSKGHNCVVVKFSELDLSKNYANQVFLYQTSEVIGSFYKRYIEDIIFHLEKQGAIVLPRYEYLKAHHNKVYMEMIRFRFLDEKLKTITSRCYCSENAALQATHIFPVVIKQTSGAGSEGVYLANNDGEYKKCVHKAGAVVVAPTVGHFVKKILKDKVKFFLSKSKIYPQRLGDERVFRPIVIQNYIEGLNGDYKVLVFGKKYYMLYRKNRDHDFRASGSGKLYEVPEIEQRALLDFAKKLTQEIDFPILGMDIGFDGAKYHLLEFQMIHLGPYALQASDYWHEYKEGQWVKIEGKSELEDEYSRSIIEYIEQKDWA